MFKKFLFISLTFALTSGFTFELIDKPGSQYIVEGLQARDSEDYPAAIAAFEKAIEASIDNRTKAKAMAQMGIVYLRQDPITHENAQKAVALLQKSEALGYTRAALILGNAYKDGKIGEADFPTAYSYFMRIKDRYPEALLALSEIVAEPPKARAYFAQATDKIEQQYNPSADLLVRIAKHYRDGEVVAQNFTQAEYWYRKAVAQKSLPAMLQLARMWQDNNHQPETETVDLWKKAAEMGDERAALEMGFIYAEGRLVPADADISGKYFEQAVDQSPINAYRIARWYEEQAVNDPAYHEVAFNWFRVAAVKGHPEAIIRQARAYWKGERVPMDRARAKTLYHLAAKQGSDKALPEMYEYETRERVKEQQRIAKEAERKRKKEEKARFLARKKAGGLPFWKPLANQGDTEAMLRVGEIYIQGNGVERDVAAGMKWMKKAADRRNGEAMYSMAQLYSAGLGAQVNMQYAYEWYEKAANVGYAPGQYQLGLGYAKGIGVEKDLTKAREWLNKASRNGYLSANDILNNLSEDQI